jgi:hypothetical protein
VEDTIARLLEVSDNAQQRGDPGYARITVENAVAAGVRNCGKSRFRA